MRRGCRFGLLASVAALWGCNGAPESTCALPCGDAPVSESRAATSAEDASRVGFCGDGVWDPAREECDDGSACEDGQSCTDDRQRCPSSAAGACQPRGNDGCSEHCTVEPGYICARGTYCVALGRVGVLTSPATQDPTLSPEDDSSPTAEQTGETPDASSPPTPGCRRWTFGAPEQVTGLDANLELSAPSLTRDGRTLFFAASQPNAVEHIYSSTRADGGRHFSSPTLLADIDSGSGDGAPLLSFDGRTLYFSSLREGGSGDRDLWFATRSDPMTQFGPPRRVGGVNSPGVDQLPWVSADELTLLYVSTRAGGVGYSDVWRSQRASRLVDFGEPQLLSAISGSAEEGRAVESSDGRALVFASSRDGGQGGQDLWLSSREAAGGELGLPANLIELNSADLDGDPFLSADDRELFFCSNRNGRPQIWRALIECQ